MGKTALITGATAGIGMATARILASKGYRLIICGRRESRLQQLSTELATQTDITHLSFDVREREAVNTAIDSLPDSFRQIDVLVNNAGNAHGLDPIQSGSTDDWDAMMDINVKGLLYVSRAIIPGMVERKNGHIINVGSIAGQEVYPQGNVYCASKFAVDALNKGMRMDLYDKGIRVGAVNPGLVATEFSEVRFKGDTERAESVYQGYRPLQAEDVAATIAFMLEAPAHVNIADVLILPSDQAASKMVNKA